MKRRGRPVVLLVLFLALAMLLGACSGSDPDDRVRAAAASTFDGEFAFALTASADAEAMAALGPDAGSVALALDGFSLIGVRTTSGTQVALQVRDDVRLVELVTLANGDVYVRTDATAMGAEGLRRLLVDLEASGASRAVAAGVEALFGGAWVGIEGQAGLEGLLDEVVPSDDASVDETPADVAALADLDLAEVLDTLLRAAEVGDPSPLPAGAERFPLTVSAERVGLGLDRADDDLGGVPVLGGLLRALEAGEVAGDVVVQGDVVTSLELALAAGDVRAGQLQLRLDLDDHGQVPQVAPPDAVVVAAEDLAAALVALLTPAS